MNGVENEKGNHLLGNNHKDKSIEVINNCWECQGSKNILVCFEHRVFSVLSLCLQVNVRLPTHTRNRSIIFEKFESILSTDCTMEILGDKWTDDPSLLPHWNFKEFTYLLGSSTFLTSQNGFIYSYLTPQRDFPHLLIGVYMTCRCTECLPTEEQNVLSEQMTNLGQGMRLWHNQVILYIPHYDE